MLYILKIDDYLEFLTDEEVSGRNNVFLIDYSNEHL